MLDIYLKKYLSGDSTTGYNAPHKYRLPQNSAFKNDILKIWNINKVKVLQELVTEIQELGLDDNKTAFAVAPSNTEPFKNDIETYIQAQLPLATNITSCFTKRTNDNAISLTHQLTNDEMRSRYTLDENCFNQKMNKEINHIILVDDIFALGNTFSAMKLLIRDIDNNIKIKTAVILNTNNE